MDEEMAFAIKDVDQDDLLKLPADKVGSENIHVVKHRGND